MKPYAFLAALTFAVVAVVLFVTGNAGLGVVFLGVGGVFLTTAGSRRQDSEGGLR